MEVSLSSVRGIGYKKIDRYFASDMERFISALKNISCKTLRIKVSPFTFLNNWESINACEDEALRGIKSWVIASYPLVLSLDIDKQMKQKFARALNLFIDRYVEVSKLDSEAVSLIVDLSLKLPVLIAESNNDFSVYSILISSDKQLKEDIDYIGRFFNCLFTWNTLTRSETHLSNCGTNVYEILCDLATTDNEEFVNSLLKA